MTKRVHTSSPEGFAATSDVDEYTIEIDPTGETAADTLDQLLAAYATCFIPALRVGAKQRDVGDLGSIDIEVTGTLNDSDKLDSIAFDVEVGAALDEEQASTVCDRALELCKVHDALKESLKADVSINGYAQ